MAKQRNTKNLGLVHSLNNPEKYKYIEEKLGIKYKKCSRGNTAVPHHRYKFFHDGPNPLPIREFNFQKTSKDLLQPNCRNCEKKYRRGRLDRYRKKFQNMSKQEIYDNFRNEYQNFKKCGHCKINKDPESFALSIGMETGLHNMCYDCSKSYSESVGDRWYIFSPDGHHVVKKNKNQKCKICNIKENLHKDHIWPISKGGTDNIENIQMLCQYHNLSKSNTITLNNINDINPQMICKRYNDILTHAIENNFTIANFEIKIMQSVRKFLIFKKELNDNDLKDFFIKEKRMNNRKHMSKDSNYGVKKFKKFCDKIRFDSDDWIN